VKRRSSTLASASAYYRLAAKAGRAGNYVAAEHYTKIADRKIAEHNRQKESMVAFRAAIAKAEGK
jgi:hypothetical protein